MRPPVVLVVLDQQGVGDVLRYRSIPRHRLGHFDRMRIARGLYHAGERLMNDITFSDEISFIIAVVVFLAICVKIILR